MTPSKVAARFQARMVPLALVVGIMVATVPPASFAFNARARLESTAARNAEAIAAGIADVAARQPELWRYNLPKVIRALSTFRDSGGANHVVVTECDGATLFGSEALGFERQDPRDIVARRPVRGTGGVVAWVEVGVSPDGERATLRLWWLASSLFGAFVALVLFSFPARVVRASAQRLEAANRDLAAAHAALAASNAELETRVAEARERLREVARDAVATQEDERARIARDLHDSLGQHLAAQRFAVDRLAGEVPDERLEPLRALNAALFDDLRRAIDDLGPAELERGGLEQALRAHCEAFELRSGLPVSTRVDLAVEPDPEVCAALLRVLGEALTNAARHARASEIGVSCTADERHVVLEVRDDGRGLGPLPEPDARRGTGIAGMRVRLELIGGELEVLSGPDGVLVRATAPVTLAQDRASDPT